MATLQGGKAANGSKMQVSSSKTALVEATHIHLSILRMI